MADTRLPPVAVALKSSFIRFVFAIYLLALVYAALDQGFWLAAVAFLIFAAGIALIGVRKFTSEWEQQQYIKNL